MSGDLRSPEQWCEHYGLFILDADGWRTTDAPPWEQPIGLDEFWRRFAECTVRNVGDATSKRITDDLRRRENG